MNKYIFVKGGEVNSTRIIINCGVDASGLDWLGKNVHFQSLDVSHTAHFHKIPYWLVPLRVEPHNFLSRFGSLLV